VVAEEDLMMIQTSRSSSSSSSSSRIKGFQMQLRDLSSSHQLPRLALTCQTPVLEQSVTCPPAKIFPLSEITAAMEWQQETFLLRCQRVEERDRNSARSKSSFYCTRP
jgi:hypothetical protein